MKTLKFSLRSSVFLASLCLACFSQENMTVLASEVGSDYSLAVHQSKKNVTGVVLDPMGEPLIGVSIKIKGSTIGTITDFDGNFTLNVKSGDILEVSYVGFLSQEITYRDQANLKITLKEDTQNLEEVIVVGFGTQKKVNLTGSVANVDNKLIESRPMTSVSAGLQGLLPGVTIAQRSGQPGSDGGTIRVRGTGTFNNANPMVIVDGIEGTMNDIDPNDIQSISVLKDAASSAIYGSKAANGVILITTKRGKEGKTSISYSGNFGWQSATELPEYCSSADYAILTNEALGYAGKDPIYTKEDIQKFRDGSSPYTHPNTNWQDLLFTESGFQQQHNVSFTGGANSIRYMASLGYQGQEGIIKHANKDQYNLRLNLDANPLDKLETSFSMSYSNQAVKNPISTYAPSLGQIFRQVAMISPMVPYKNEDGSYGTIGDGNPIAWIDLNQVSKTKNHNLAAIASAKYYFLPELSLKGQASYRLNAGDTNTFKKDIQYNPNKYHGPNEMWQSHNTADHVMGDIMAEYKKSFGGHNLDVLAGFHSELWKYKYTQAYRKNFPSNSITDINAGSEEGAKASGYTRELAMLSWLGRVNYDYEGKYLFEANIRYDGSSRFASGNRWGAFPSFSAGWRVSEENFFEPLRDVVNNLKLRASWGQLGNQNISLGGGQEYYPTIPTLSLGQNYPFDGKLESGAYTSKAKNKDLKWETTTSWGVGVDFTFINKVNMTLEYYNKTTSDILMEVPTPETYALTGFFDNIGKIENQGIELSLSYNDNFGGVNFNVGGNFAYNKNKIKSLGEGVKEILKGTKIMRVGESLNSFYGYKTAGFYQNTEDLQSWPKYNITGNKVMLGDLKYVDVNGDNVIDGNDRVVLNSTDPKYTFGFNIGADYKGFDFIAFFQGAAGVSGYMETEAIGSINGDDGKPSVIWKDRWTPDNPNAKYPRVTEGLNGVSMPSTISDFWQQDAKYLRLKNVQFGYSFPKEWLSKINISKARIYYSGQNLLTFTNFLNGWDPEAPSGRGDFYPQIKVHSIGVNVTF